MPQAGKLGEFKFQGIHKEGYLFILGVKGPTYRPEVCRGDKDGHNLQVEPRLPTVCTGGGNRRTGQ